MIKTLQPLAKVFVALPGAVGLGLGIEVHIGLFQGFTFGFSE